MANKNNAPSLLQGFSRFLKPADKALDLAPQKKEMDAEDELHHLPARPFSDGVQVMEVDQAEFLREWGQAVAQKVLADKEADTDTLIDRRLPNFDRRHPEGERRDPERSDRRHGSPWPIIRAKVERRIGLEDRRELERRADRGQDRRTPSLVVKTKKTKTKVPSR